MDKIKHILLGTLRFVKESWIALALLVIFVAFSFGSAWGLRLGAVNIKANSLTFDEISHIGSSYHYVDTQSIIMNSEHPPLVKVVVGIPLQFVGAEPGKLDPSIENREDNQWNYGASFLFDKNRMHSGRIIAVARLTITLLNALLLFCIYSLLKRIISKRAGTLALALLAFNPAILGHASLVTFDVPGALTILVCLLCYVHYLRRPSLKRTFLVAATLALALLTKFSTAVLVPMILIIGPAVLLLRKSKRHEWGVWLRDITVIGIVSLFLVATFMLIMTSNMPVEVVQKQFSENWPGHLEGVKLGILRQLAELGAYPKALAIWLNGFLIIQHVVDIGKGGTYFLGTVYGQNGPGLWYYPVLFLTKLPLGILMVSFAAVLSIFAQLRHWLTKRRKGNEFIEHYAAVLLLTLGLFSLAYFVFSSLQPFKIGFRHFLPFTVTFQTMAAILIDIGWNKQLWHKALRLSRVFFVGITLAVVSTLSAFPYYISYYNLLAGGTWQGYRIATDSNYDWGQDLARLQEWRQSHNSGILYTDLFVNPFGVESLYVSDFKNIDALADGAQLPSGSVVAVSATRMQHREKQHPNLSFDVVYGEPTDRTGPSIFIFSKK